MKIIDHRTFFEIISGFEIVPYTQTPGMYEFQALSGRGRIKFFVNQEENPTIACIGHEKQMLKKKMLLIEGECYAKKINFENRKRTNRYISDLQNFYEEIKKMSYDVVEIQSNAGWNFHYETALRLSGFLRPVGLFSLQSTQLVDLTKEIKYDRNWLRNLKKSATYDLNFKAFVQPDEDKCAAFSKIYNDMCNRKTLQGQLSTQQVFALCSDSHFIMLLTFYKDIPVSGIIIYLDEKNKRSEGIYAGSTSTALSTQATFFMYHNMFMYLKNLSCTIYDLAKILPTSTEHQVFQFKNGISGMPIPLNGEFSWYKKQYYRPLMYFVKRYLLKKKEI